LRVASVLIGLAIFALSSCSSPIFGGASDPLPADTSDIDHLLPKLPNDYSIILFELKELTDAGAVEFIEFSIALDAGPAVTLLLLCVRSAAVDTPCHREDSASLELPVNDRFAEPQEVGRVLVSCGEAQCDADDLNTFSALWTVTGR